MTIKSATSLTALAVVLGFTMPAMAQTPPAQQKPAATTEAPKTPVTGQIVTQEGSTILAKDLIGQSVYESDNKTKIGSISDLVLSKDGKSVNGFVIGVGGFLGIGEKNVALQMDRLRIAAEPDTGGVRLTMDVKKDELANAPAFKTRKEQESEKQAAERPRNAPQPGAPGPSPKPGTGN